MLKHLPRAGSRERVGPLQPTTTGALVIGGDYRGLGVVRSLGRRGIPVWVLTDEHRVAATSRYIQRAMPWPDGDESEQIEFLLDLAARHGARNLTIFPTGDATAAMLSRNSERLQEYYRLTVPAWDIMQWTCDKRLTYRLAQNTSVDQPRTLFPSSRSEVAELSVHFPVILKPAVKDVPSDFTRSKAWQVENREELLAAYDLACTMVDPAIIMIQDLIPGGGDTQVSYAALCDEGRPLASMTARRLRQYPIDFGRFSTCVETVDLPEVAELAERLLLDLRYTGLIEVEFKFDRQTNRYQLLDLNPRVWGWHSLAQRAGVDFPYLMWLFANGEPVPSVRARPDVRWVRLLADLLAAGRGITRGDLSVHAYVRSLRRPLEFALFAADDPLPALLDLPLQFDRIRKR